MSDQNNCQLYLITPPRLDPVAFADVLKRTLDGGAVACLQLRLKTDDEQTADVSTILKAAEVLMPIAQSRDIAFIINDLPEVAARIGADGVHVGQQDMAYAKAREIVGPDAIVGVTCHDSRHLAMAAGEAGADYVAFGAFFPTTTKEPKAQADIDLLAWWAQVFEVPCVAIGGITTENATPLIKAGADFLAVSSGVWAHPEGPAAAVAAFNRLMAQER